MARKKRQRAPRRLQSRRARTAGHSNAYEVISFEVTTEPLYELPENKLPPELASQLDRLYDLVNTRPGDAIIELENLRKRYPDCPKLLNFLGGAYHGIGREDKAEQIATDAYKRFPNYLFAKLIYADLCLVKGRMDEFAAVLEEKFELMQLCPDRKRFHLTEVVAFFGSVGYYFSIQGDTERARTFHEILRSLDPKGPMTKRLERVIKRTWFGSLISAINRRSSPKPSRSTADVGAD